MTTNLKSKQDDKQDVDKRDNNRAVNKQDENQAEDKREDNHTVDDRALNKMMTNARLLCQKLQIAQINAGDFQALDETNCLGIRKGNAHQAHVHRDDVQQSISVGTQLPLFI